MKKIILLFVIFGCQEPRPPPVILIGKTDVRLQMTQKEYQKQKKGQNYEMDLDFNFNGRM